MRTKEQEEGINVLRRGLPQKALCVWPESDMILEMSTVNGRLEWIELQGGFKTLQEFFKHQTVVSLGCGSPSSTYGDSGWGSRDKKDYEAWLPRLAWAYGAKTIIGIDVRDGDPKDKDVYIHKTADIIPLLLAASGLVDYLKRMHLVGKVKFLDCNAVFGQKDASSPTYIDCRAGHLKNYDERHQFDRNMERSLVKQSETILADGGMLFYNYNLLMLKDRRWHLLFRLDKDWTPPVSFIDQTMKKEL